MYFRKSKTDPIGSRLISHLSLFHFKKEHLRIQLSQNPSGALRSGIGQEDLPKSPLGYQVHQPGDPVIVKLVKNVIQEEQRLFSFGLFEDLKLRQLQSDDE